VEIQMAAFSRKPLRRNAARIRVNVVLSFSGRILTASPVALRFSLQVRVPKSEGRANWPAARCASPAGRGFCLLKVCPAKTHAFFISLIAD
jgi:hypothetical protein